MLLDRNRSIPSNHSEQRENNMAKIEPVEAGSIGWVAAIDTPKAAEHLKTLRPEDLAYKVRMLHLGDEMTMEVFEVDFEPDYFAAPHAHDADEVFYVLQGELRLGRRGYGPGSSIKIPANTLYSFRAGPDGLRFVNFRPRGEVRSIFRDEFMATRKAADLTDAPSWRHEQRDSVIPSDSVAGLSTRRTGRVSDELDPVDERRYQCITVCGERITIARPEPPACPSIPPIDDFPSPNS